MTPYEITEHTADLGIRARGRTMAELLADAGTGLFTVIAPGFETRPEASGTIQFSIDADSPQELFHEWLDTLNVRHQLEGAVLHGFEISVEGNRLHATAQAQPFDPRVQEPGIEVKAVTWHELYLRESGDGFEGFALLDI